MSKNKNIITLSTKEQEELHAITHTGNHSSRIINRAHILLYSHAGKSKNTIAELLHISRSTVQRIRDHYRTENLERALYDNPRSGQPKKLADKAEAHLVALACSDPPEGRALWTLELLAQKMVEDGKVKKISHMCIRAYLTNRGIKPWLEKNVVHSHTD